MATVRVRANAAVLGLRPGQEADVENTAYLRKVIEKGKLTRVDTEDKTAKGKAAKAEAAG